MTALASSRDLVTWTAEPPFWDPGLYITHECPEVFAMGEWWYLTFSEFSERFTAQYRMSRHPLGPWRAPADPSLDGAITFGQNVVVQAGIGETLTVGQAFDADSRLPVQALDVVPPHPRDVAEHVHAVRGEAHLGEPNANCPVRKLGGGVCIDDRETIDGHDVRQTVLA